MGLVLGNRKIGPSIHQWSLRSGPDCPGKTELCSKHCYAAHGHFMWPSVKAAHAKNRKEAAKPNFVDKMNIEIKAKRVKIMRIHVDGDLYDTGYAKNWYEICKANPNVVFFIYTRSWRKPRIRHWIYKLAELHNVSVWFSVDKETGEPPTNRPQRVRLAYMQVAHTDIPSYKVDLFFRIKELKDQVAKKIVDGSGHNTLVCPTETGMPHAKEITCTRCKFCYKPSFDHVRASQAPSAAPAEQTTRVPLQMVA